MGPYGFSLALGVVGLVAMAFLGFSHHSGGHAGSHAAGHGHAGHDSGFGGHGHTGTLGHAGHAGGHGGHDAGAHHGPDAGHGHAGQVATHGLARLTSLLSPRVLFSFLVGLGATGLLVKPFLFEPLVAGAALAGGFVFERWLVAPIWNFLFRFESRQAATLESAIMEEARAMTDFDRNGQGLIQLELDGQVLQLLGTLRPEDRQAERRIRRGDLLRIEEVDPIRNRCSVSYVGADTAELAP